MTTAVQEKEPAKLELSKPLASGTNVQSLLEQYRKAFEAAAPQHLDVNRMMRLAIMSVGRNRSLLECTASSLLGAFMTSVQLGLDIGLGLAYLVPFYNSTTKRKEVQFIPDYRGLVQLATNTGEVTAVWAVPVYGGDDFEYVEGLERRLEHRPSTRSLNPHDLHAVYAVARYRDGFMDFEVMFKNEVDAVKSRSKAKSGPWQTDYFEMAKKTVIKRLAKKLPKSVEMATAVTLDDRAAMGRPQGISLLDAGSDHPVIDIEPDDEPGEQGGPTKNTGALDMEDLKAGDQTAEPPKSNGSRAKLSPAKQKIVVDVWEQTGRPTDALDEFLERHGVRNGALSLMTAADYDRVMVELGKLPSVGEEP